MRTVPLLLMSLILAAHHFRAGEPGLIGLWLSLPFALWFRRRWLDRAVQVLLLAGGTEWVLTILAFASERRLAGQTYGRMALILGAVAVLTAASGLLLETRGRRDRLPKGDLVWPGLGAFLLALLIMVPVQLNMDPAGLLLERFVPAGGWWELVALAFYAGWLSDRLQDARQIRKVRPKVWLMFSGIFFTQLILGVAGFDQLLMTGKLHLPVPAIIAAGPLYRGGGYFMAILFSVSVVLVGPAWCSWLCYIGAWDDKFSRARRRPDRLPPWRNRMRIAVLIVVMATAFGLGRLGVGTFAAGWLAASFGLVGIGLMVFWSRKRGHMTHCTAWCPMGWVATRLGKVSPWRLKITPACTDCGACTPACRYDALYPEDVARRVPGEACTLCGDCLSNCPTGSIGINFPGLTPSKARMVFLGMVAAMHAAWIGVARL
jgi:ferredoxin